MVGHQEMQESELMLFIRIVGAICIRTWLKIIRRPVILVFSLVQPLMWMVFFGFLFHRYTLQDSGVTTRYLDFLLPGVCFMTVLFGASQSGTGLIRDLQTGFLRRIILASNAPGAILAGKILSDSIRVLLQAMVIACVGCLLGARIHPHFLALTCALSLLILFAFGYSSLSCWIALKTRSQEAMGIFIQALNMPLLFTSTVLVPDKHMQGWLSKLAEWNPISAVTDGLRFALLGLGQPITLHQLALAVLAGAFLFSASIWQLNRVRSS